jgi:deazaflavin-dependent oxidoreductase (nitroreductase family)
MSDYVQPDITLLGDEHVARYRETDGEVGYEWNGAPTLLLTTTGRKTGNQRTVPLIFGPDGDRCLVVGSKGGAPDHPNWYKNLAANPEVDVQVKGDRFRATARTLEGEERDRAWEIVTQVWPNYNEYVKRTTRVIPVVALERSGS